MSIEDTEYWRKEYGDALNRAIKAETELLYTNRENEIKIGRLQTEIADLKKDRWNKLLSAELEVSRLTSERDELLKKHFPEHKK